MNSLRFFATCTALQSPFATHSILSIVIPSNCTGFGTLKPGNNPGGCISCGMHHVGPGIGVDSGCISRPHVPLLTPVRQLVWAIQYQADVWARPEQLERLRRKGSAEASLIPNHTFSSAKPWEWCFQQLVDECAGFWRRELEDPGGLVKSGATPWRLLWMAMLQTT